MFLQRKRQKRSSILCNGVFESNNMENNKRGERMLLEGERMLFTSI